jgi:predicted O-linked N-acetylglucosamine transferase (SPINDLY family)
MSYLDNAYVVGLFRKFVKNNKVIANDGIPAELYSNIGYYLMNSGLQNFAADMFKISLEKKYDDDTAIIYLQNLMYTSCEDYNEERIFEITKTVMAQILANSDFKEKFTNYKNDLNPNKILNIGYTCHFFDNETSSNLLLPILKAHDRNRVKIFIYSDQDPSITKSSTKELTDVWRDTYKMSNKEFCELVRKDQIDILLELNGFCLRNRYKAINTKPAPVQVSFYNLSATSGVGGIDYIISTDDIKLNQNFYSEKIINKSGAYLTISPDIKKISDVPPCVKNGYITFGSFGQIHKVSRDQIMLWVEILKQVDGSKLFLKSSNLHRKEIVLVLKKHFEDAGIEFENRTIIEGSSEYSELLKCYERVDIALDTFPYGGGTTTSEAILCGVPVVHLTGERFCSQHGTNYLRYFNIEELICANKEEFVTTAITLAHDKKKIIWYRENLPDLSRKSKKCDIKNYTSELEDTYHKMWYDYCKSHNK